MKYLLFFFVGCCCCLWPIELAAKTWKVGADRPLATICEALLLAADGDTVLIGPGTYREGSLHISKSLYLKGEDYPILDGENQFEALVITAPNVTVEGLQIQRVGRSHIEDRAGIRVKRTWGFRLLNNRLYDTFFGIYLEHAKEGVVIGNTIVGIPKGESHSGNAIHAWYCKKILVEDNLTRFHRDGIYLEFVDSSQIRNNLSADHLRYGLHFMFSNDDEYENNEFRNNGAGVAVMFSRRIVMRKNLFIDNWGRASYGLLLKEIYDAEIRYNRFERNTLGIYVEGSNRITYQYNDFVQNGWAIKMAGGCLDNLLTDNNFIGNTFDLSMSSSPNNNRLEHNYWSEYEGYDLDKDDIGDIPFRPISLFSYVVDRNPEALVLLRSLLVDALNYAEKVSPALTPAEVLDRQPSMIPLSFSPSLQVNTQ